MELKLTTRQVQALLWAIELTKARYDGWSNADKGAETVADLRILSTVYGKLLDGEAAANA
jgi:hypothetical protein